MKQTPRLASILLFIVLLGASIRGAHLPQQLPFHDDWHVLRAVAEGSWSELATTFGANDRSIPIALYLELCSIAGRLDGWTVWLPSFVSGVAALLVLPLLSARMIGPRAADLFALSMSLSPLLIYYSRSIRPYMMSSSLAVVAALALAHWWERGGRRAAAAFVLATTSVAWLMPLHAVFCVGSWFGFSVWTRHSPERDRRRFCTLLGLASAVAVSAIALLGPALYRDGSSLLSKAGRGEPDFGAALRAVGFLLGVEGAAATLAAVTIAGIGAVEILRRSAGPAVALLSGSVALVLAIFVSRPAEMQRPFVLARYLLPVGIVLLISISGALAAALSRWISGNRSVHFASVALMAAGLLFVHPEVLPVRRPDSFGSARLFRDILVPEGVVPVPAVLRSGAYRDLVAMPPGSMAILEVPFAALRSHPYPYLQPLHRQRVFVGVGSGPCSLPGSWKVPTGGQEGFRFAGIVDIDRPEELAALGIDRILVHRDLAGEMPWVKSSAWRGFDADRCASWLESELGRRASSDDALHWIALGATGVPEAPAEGT